MNLAKNLQYLLKKNKMTLAALSRETGVPPQTLHNWICGAEPRSIRQLKRVASYFLTTIDTLCF